MEKSRKYDHTFFSADVLREAYRTLKNLIDPLEEHELRHRLTVNSGDTTWRHDDLEEFFADYRVVTGRVYFSVEPERSTSWHMAVWV